MGKKNLLTKICAIAGTMLVWLPVLAAILFSVIGLIRDGSFNLDFLIPAELGLVEFLGAGLLLLTAILSHSRLKWIAWCFGIAILLIVGGQSLAVVTGLASGAIEASGWQYLVTLGMIIGYDVALILLGIGGILLCRDQFSAAK